MQLIKLAKRLKKEKVNVDIINFGEEVRCIRGYGSVGMVGFLSRFIFNPFQTKLGWGTEGHTKAPERAQYRPFGDIALLPQQWPNFKVPV